MSKKPFLCDKCGHPDGQHIYNSATHRVRCGVWIVAEGKRCACRW